MGFFLELSFDLQGLDPQEAQAACFAVGAGSVTLMDAGDDAVLEPLPAEVRLWPATRVCALFTEEAHDLRDRLSTALGVDSQRITIRRIEDRIWERVWLKDFHARCFGTRLWVCPHHEQVEEPAAVVVRLDPGMAFGTGTHPTTALCLEWLDAHLVPGARVIDYGCGSGILAVAALKLGARCASCFDIDPQALLAARENAEANGVTAQLAICPDAEWLPTADVVVANILSEPLKQLAPRFARLLGPGGQVLLAGLMQSEASSVTDVYGAWFDMRTFGCREGWTALLGRRRTKTPSDDEAP